MTGIPSLFVDECVRGDIISYLRSRGIDLMSIVDIEPGAIDPIVLKQSVIRQRVLITADYDFGELQFRDGEWRSALLS